MTRTTTSNEIRTGPFDPWLHVDTLRIRHLAERPPGWSGMPLEFRPHVGGLLARLVFADLGVDRARHRAEARRLVDLTLTLAATVKPLDELEAAWPRADVERVVAYVPSDPAEREVWQRIHGWLMRLTQAERRALIQGAIDKLHQFR